MFGQKSTSDPNGITGKLCKWVADIDLSQVPEDIQLRAKLILLDGLGCGLVGAHLPWSERAAKVILDLEPPGQCSVIGWKEKLSATAAALLNSTFIQGFELDDWHTQAPLHSAALLIPALLAAAEHSDATGAAPISGASFLLALIVGFEVGPRIGLALGGAEMLSRGWHSGAVFGGPAVAMAVSKLLGLSPQQMEWALGIACTQAGGLMSAQYGSMGKRMQHGFPSRNGLLAAFLARSDYTGIECVLERPYGGFIGTFSPHIKDLSAVEASMNLDSVGTRWEIKDIIIKLYPLMAALHAPVDCVRALQDKYKDLFETVDSIQSIKIEMGEVAYKHGGWKVEKVPLEVTGAQMNAAYAVAVQLVDRKVVPTSFATGTLDRDILYDLIKKTVCELRKDFSLGRTRVTISFSDHADVVETLEMPRGIVPKLSKEEVVEKWEILTTEILDEKRRKAILQDVMRIEQLSSLDQLIAQLEEEVGSVLG